MELFWTFNAKSLVVFVSWPRFVRVEDVLVPWTERSIRDDTSTTGSPVVHMFSFVLPDTETTDWEFTAFQALRPLESEPAIEDSLKIQSGKCKWFDGLFVFEMLAVHFVVWLNV